MINQLKVHNLYLAQDDNILTTYFAALQHVFQNVFKNTAIFFLLIIMHYFVIYLIKKIKYTKIYSCSTTKFLKVFRILVVVKETVF